MGRDPVHHYCHVPDPQASYCGPGLFVKQFEQRSELVRPSLCNQRLIASPFELELKRSDPIWIRSHQVPRPSQRLTVTAVPRI